MCPWSETVHPLLVSCGPFAANLVPPFPSPIPLSILFVRVQPRLTISGMVFFIATGSPPTDFSGFWAIPKFMVPECFTIPRHASPSTGPSFLCIRQTACPRNNISCAVKKCQLNRPSPFLVSPVLYQFWGSFLGLSLASLWDLLFVAPTGCIPVFLPG